MDLRGNSNINMEPVLHIMYSDVRVCYPSAYNLIFYFSVFSMSRLASDEPQMVTSSFGCFHRDLESCPLKSNVHLLPTLLCPPMEFGPRCLQLHQSNFRTFTSMISPEIPSSLAVH